MKKGLFTILFLMLFSALTACGNADNNSAENGTSNNKEDLWESVKDKGVLTVGTEGTYAPFTFHDENDQLTGYDVEVIKEVGKRLDLEVDFKETQWDSMFSGLNSKRFDLIANQVGKTGREDQYDFSEKYTTSKAVVVSKADNNSIKSEDDVKGKTSAQSLTSNYNDLAKEAGANVQGVEGLAQALQLIQQGRADITFNDKLAVLNYLTTSENKDVKIAFETGDPQETYFAFRKGSNSLVEQINKALDEMKEDGTLSKISEKWFGEDVSN